jgi:uncharacterized protein (DUF1330 family)
MAKGYWVSAYHEIHDENFFGAYLELAGPAIIAAGGKFIARGPAAKVYESGILQRTTLIEFPSLDAALAAHDTADYQAALKALDGGVTRDLRVVGGTD